MVLCMVLVLVFIYLKDFRIANNSAERNLRVLLAGLYMQYHLLHMQAQSYRLSYFYQYTFQCICYTKYFSDKDKASV